MKKYLLCSKYNSAWVRFVAIRYMAHNRGSKNIMALLSIISLSFGIITLIVVISVMNNLQQGQISAILELNSYHMQISGKTVQRIQEQPEILEKLRALEGIRQIFYFGEIQVLLDFNGNNENAVLRIIEPRMIETDQALRDLFNMYGSVASLEDNSILLGINLAHQLQAVTGNTISIMNFSYAKNTTSVLANAKMIVSHVFSSPTYDTLWGFISLDTAQEKLGFSDVRIGIKLDNYTDDIMMKYQLIQLLSELFDDDTVNIYDDIITWREYNRAIFGALRVEKVILLLLIGLIFIVVAINVYQAMCRTIYDKKEEIALLRSLGSSARNIVNIFVIEGFIIGFISSVIGGVIGIIVTNHLSEIIKFGITFFSAVQFVFTNIMNFIQDKPTILYPQISSDVYFIIAQTQARLVLHEVVLICIYALCAVTIAAWRSARIFAYQNPSDILRR